MTEVICLCVSGQVTIRTTSDRTYVLQIDKSPNESLSIELSEDELGQVMTFMHHVIDWRRVGTSP